MNLTRLRLAIVLPTEPKMEYIRSERLSATWLVELRGYVVGSKYRDFLIGNGINLCPAFKHAIPTCWLPTSID